MNSCHRELQPGYQQLVETVTAAVNDWDPWDLLRSGAPDDEFLDEVTKVVAKLPEARTLKALAEVISAVFSEAFGSAGFSAEECEPVASRILADLADFDFSTSSPPDP